jgi:hypothetical protein
MDDADGFAAVAHLPGGGLTDHGFLARVGQHGQQHLAGVALGAGGRI